MARRPSFEPGRALVAALPLTFKGVPYKVNDPFPVDGIGSIPIRQARLMFESRRAKYPDEIAAEPEQATDAMSDDPVQMTATSGGWYELSAPWVDTPERVRGKKNADARLAELREAGPPLGFIPGGSEVTVSGGDGGWYEISAPWLAEPEKVQGRDAAETRQRELHEAGPPIEPISKTDALIMISVDGDNAWSIKAPWMAEAEHFDTVEAADARQAELRANIVTVEPGAVMTEAEGKFVVSAPWIADDAREVFDTEEAANARAVEVREAGPPEDWVPAEAPAASE